MQIFLRLRRFFNVGYLFLLAGLIVIAIGHIFQNGLFDLLGLWDTMWANIGAEALSIAATVLVIDRLNRRRASDEERNELIWNTQNSDNTIAVRSFMQLKRLGWLDKEEPTLRCSFNRSRLESLELRNVNLSQFNFMQADLTYADLRFSNLEQANMQRARMRFSKLMNCDLRQANLQAADLGYSVLREADLRGANLSGANLTQAKLRRATIDEHTKLSNVTLPNGKTYTSDQKVRRVIIQYQVRIVRTGTQ